MKIGPLVSTWGSQGHRSLSGSLWHQGRQLKEICNSTHTTGPKPAQMMLLWVLLYPGRSFHWDFKWKAPVWAGHGTLLGLDMEDLLKSIFHALFQFSSFFSTHIDDCPQDLDTYIENVDPRPWSFTLTSSGSDYHSMCICMRCVTMGKSLLPLITFVIGTLLPLSIL